MAPFDTVVAVGSQTLQIIVTFCGLEQTLL